MRSFIEMRRDGPPFDDEELEALMQAAGPMDGAGIDDMDESMMDKYAEHIRNYLYTYKEGAQNIDPKATPDQEHVGPMAQDLEQVNPAVIEETPEGVKTVDTGRLALMNAGVIADICRRLDAIEDFLENLSSDPDYFEQEDE